MKPARISPETRQEALRRVVAALRAAEGEDAHESLLTPETGAEAAVDAVVDVLWRKAVGDANDRVATALHAARALLEADQLPAEVVAAKRRGLRRALDSLDHPAAWPDGAKGPNRG